MSNRPDWNTYFLDIAKAVCKRSTCLRRHYGAVIVKDKVIISTGYNGAPIGEPNCCDIGTCKREQQHIPKGERYELCNAVHAEQNAIIHGDPIKMKGSTIYIYGEEVSTLGIANGAPCLMCDRMIRNAGIKEAIYLLPNQDGNFYLVHYNICSNIKDAIQI